MTFLCRHLIHSDSSGQNNDNFLKKSFSRFFFMSGTIQLSCVRWVHVKTAEKQNSSHFLLGSCFFYHHRPSALTGVIACDRFKAWNVVFETCVQILRFVVGSVWTSSFSWIVCFFALALSTFIILCNVLVFPITWPTLLAAQSTVVFARKCLLQLISSFWDTCRQTCLAVLVFGKPCFREESVSTRVPLCMYSTDRTNKTK